ncbi:MAG: GMP/IMP nucleotidase [Trichlorobacter sp.]|uniref:GMP/IMP nucleotidase n=1 Tax=Trichlorobacter sp. TaxID=2911007 RepID=UPI0025640AD0|nr:GMP/IMP nucleotidase [Trichlorobacter sp.]MDK9718585.1 GMP/IMP nucleotidase [Trichlorobacter sp.]
MLLDWHNIDTVLLDMDGTLLDRHFDDHFWLEHVPKRWAAKHNVSPKQAREQLHALFRSQERTLNWTDLDYWSDRLGLDIPLLKLEVEHLIAVHPGVIEFLTYCKQHNKQLWLVTNAHGKTLDIKLKKTRIGHWFDGIISAHQVGLPKEDNHFWAELQRFVTYDPARTMLGEDSETNLQTAQEYGIRYLFYISHFSSTCTPVASDSFATLDYFTRLIPVAGESAVRIISSGGINNHVC